MEFYGFAVLQNFYLTLLGIWINFYFQNEATDNMNTEIFQQSLNVINEWLVGITDRTVSIVFPIPFDFQRFN